jgi:hypothetical protein
MIADEMNHAVLAQLQRIEFANIDAIDKSFPSVGS